MKVYNDMRGVSEGSKKTQFKKGHISHNKGKTKENYEPLRKVSESKKGLEVNDETRKKISQTKKQRYKEGKVIHPMLGKHHSEETKEKLRQKALKQFENGASEDFKEKARIRWHNNKENELKKLEEMRKKIIYPLQDSSIEIKLQKFLKLLHVEFYTHYWTNDINYKYRCDIFIPKQKGINQKTIIEADGCYWHGCEICKKSINEKILKQKERDKLRTKQLIEKGFKVIRIWEHEIRPMKLNDFKEKFNEI